MLHIRKAYNTEMPWHKPFLFLYLICSPLPFPAEKAMAPHSSTLTWKISWTEEPGRLESMGSRRVGHKLATSVSLFTFMHWRRKWQPTPVFLPGEPQGQGSLVAAIYGVTQSRTWLKWLNSSRLAAAAKSWTQFSDWTKTRKLCLPVQNTSNCLHLCLFTVFFT